jgi:hypothetical protein
VLSANAHKCYKLANCKNAAHPYLASHPGGTRGKSDLIRGNVGDLQLFYANMAVSDEKFTTVDSALEALHFGDAANKLEMIEWLAGLGVDYGLLRIRSFVHREHALCAAIYAQFCAASYLYPIASLTERLWHRRDLEHCSHGVVRCLCRECMIAGICVHGKQKYFCAECGGDGICVHGKQKYFCAECGGSGICVHGKEQRYCAECGGSGMCEHRKRKNRCTECDKAKVAAAAASDADPAANKAARSV